MPRMIGSVCVLMQFESVVSWRVFPHRLSVSNVYFLERKNWKLQERSDSKLALKGECIDNTKSDSKLTLKGECIDNTRSDSKLTLKGECIDNTRSDSKLTLKGECIDNTSF